MPPLDWAITICTYLLVCLLALASIMKARSRPTAASGFYHAAMASLGVTLTLMIVRALSGEFRMTFTDIRPLALTFAIVTPIGWFVVYLALQTWGMSDENVRKALWMHVGWTITGFMVAGMYVLPHYVPFIDHKTMLIVPGYVFFGLGFFHNMVLPKRWQGWLGDRWLNAAFGCLFCSLLIFGFSLYLPWVAR